MYTVCLRGEGYQVRDKTGIRQGQDRDKSGARQRKDRDKIREGEGKKVRGGGKKGGYLGNIKGQVNLIR